MNKIITISMNKIITISLVLFFIAIFVHFRYQKDYVHHALILVGIAIAYKTLQGRLEAAKAQNQLRLSHNATIIYTELSKQEELIKAWEDENAMKKFEEITKNKVLCEHLTESLLLHFCNAVLLKKNLPDEVSNEWVNFIRGYFKQHIVLAEKVINDKTGWPAKLGELAKEGIEEREKEEKEE